MIEVKNYGPQSVVYVTFTGKISDRELKRACDEVWWITQNYRDQPHLTCSDVRQMSVLTPSQEALLGATVRKTRLHGMRFCVHVVDPKTMRGMQLERALEQAQVPGTEDVTVYTIEEAAEVLHAARQRLGLPLESLERIADNMTQVHERLSRVTQGD